MPEKLVTSAVAIVTAIIGVAIIAVLVSKNANTSGVITAAGSSLSGLVSAATAPVTGSGSSGLGGLSSGLTGLNTSFV